MDRCGNAAVATRRLDSPSCSSGRGVLLDSRLFVDQLGRGI